MLSAGEQKRVIENPAVHPDGAANLNFRDGESNGDHAVLSIVVFTGIMRLQGETEKSLLKREGSPVKGISQEMTSPHLFFILALTAGVSYFTGSRPTKSVKTRLPVCRQTNQPAHQHIEYITAPKTQPDQRFRMEALKNVTMGSEAFIQSR